MAWRGAGGVAADPGAEAMEFGPILSVRQEAATSESEDGEGGV